MTKEELESEASLVRIIQTHYPVVRILYPDDQASLSELSNKTGTDPGNLSRYMNQLEEHGLVTTREQKGGRGKPLRLVRLTSIGLNIVKSFVEAAGTGPRKLEDADPQDIKFYLEMIVDFSNKDVQEMAVEELASLCESHNVIQDPRVLPFLKERILSPQYQPLRHGLMLSLLNIARNSTADQRREIIRPGFADALTRLLLEPLDDAQADSRATRATVIEVLSLIHEGDEGFKALTRVLIGLIEMKDHLDERAEDLIIWRFPDKRGELRRAMFSLLASPDKDVVRRAKELILRLRTRTGLSGE